MLDKECDLPFDASTIFQQTLLRYALIYTYYL